MCMINILANAHSLSQAYAYKGSPVQIARPAFYSCFGDCSVAYPYGLFFCHRQVSAHLSSIPSAAVQESSVLALAGSANIFATSPERRGAISYGMSFPHAFPKAFTISRTEYPFPV